MEYRVEQLAAACDVSVDTIRYYQSRGLLPPPRRAGRVAVYAHEHAQRIRRIRAMQASGLTLSGIARLLGGDVGRPDADLAAAVAAAHDDDEFLTLEQVAEETQVPAALLRVIQREGLVIGRRLDGEERYTAADVEAVRQGLRLLEAGFPLHELLSLAKEYDVAARELAERAVDLFDQHVRTPLRESTLGEDEASEQIIEAFRDLLPAVTALVSHHFRRVLLHVADTRIAQTGEETEAAAPAAPGRRRHAGAEGAR